MTTASHAVIHERHVHPVELPIPKHLALEEQLLVNMDQLSTWDEYHLSLSNRIRMRISAIAINEIFSLYLRAYSVEIQ